MAQDVNGRRSTIGSSGSGNPCAPNPCPPRASAMTKRTSKGSAVSRSTEGSITSSQRYRDSQDSQFQWRAVRTVPTWVQRYEDEDELLDQSPPTLPPPTHKNAQKSVWDNRRDNHPVTPRPVVNDGSRWKTFVEGSSARPFTGHSERKDLESGGGPVWGDDGLSSPWLAKKGEGEGDEDDAREFFGISAKRRQIWYKRFHVILLNNPMVPLTFRGIIWVLSVFALAFSASIYALSSRNGTPQLPSTILAIVVDAVALVYVIYITYDEYSGQPLGLRSAKAKVILLMFDLVFIIFASANLSLAFDTLYDVQQSCSAIPNPGEDSALEGRPYITNVPICARQRALASFLFLVLCAWVTTFTISVFRVVERVSRTNG